MPAKSTAPVAAPAEEVVDPGPAPAEAVPGEKQRESMITFMRKKFAAEKRVTVKLRHDGDVFVQVNGYSFLIKPNVKVEVPESLIPLLEDAGYI